MPTIRVDTLDAIRALQEAPKAAARAILKWVLQGGEYVAGQMRSTIRDTAKNPTGQLAATVRVDYGPGEAVIGPTDRETKWGTFKPEYVDQPTRPHEIRPRFSKVLMFATSGGRLGWRAGQPVTVTKHRRAGMRARTTVGPVAFANVVHHPGTKGLFFIDKTTDRVRKPLHTLLDQLLDEELKKE